MGLAPKPEKTEFDMEKKGVYFQSSKGKWKKSERAERTRVKP